MRISNMLHFTENHPFYTGRFFALGSLHYTMLHSVYQPMIGSQAISLYHVLYELLPAHQVGYSPIEQQRKLFLSLQLEPGLEGRRKLIEATSRLEAVGLLQTARYYQQQEDDYVYYYHLQPPLLPQDFFTSHHLVFLLRDTIGEAALLRLKERLLAPHPTWIQLEEMEELTVPFYELFRLSVDHQESEALASAWDEVAVSKVRALEAREPADELRFTHAEILNRFPRASRNRPYVEKLGQRRDHLAFINYTAAKYRLELPELCRLLDEEGIFDASGELNEDLFTYHASLGYLQGNKRREEREANIQKALDLQAASKPDEVPAEAEVEPMYQLDVPERFAGKCDKAQYNQMLRNEPYTRMLERFFQGKPSTHVVRLFERIHYSYKMPDEVINVMMHYIHTNRLSWSKAFVESIFTDLLAREVRDFEGAVEYIRERLEIAEKSQAIASAAKKRSSGNARSRRPAPAIVTEDVPDDPVTDEEYERILQKVRRIESKLK